MQARGLGRTSTIHQVELMRQIPRLAVLTLTLMLLCEARVAEDPALSTDNFAHESMICGVYYSLMSGCVTNRDAKGRRAESYRRSSTAFLEQAFKAGRLIGLSENALSARSEIAEKDMLSDIKNTCNNIWVLVQKYGTQCKRLHEVGLETMHWRKR
jgi:hypothetical protein